MKTLTRFLLPFAAAAIALATAVAAPAAKKSPPPLKIPEGVSIQNNIAIGHGGETTLYADISWPTNPPKTPMPVLIWVHGGGWVGQDRQTWADRRIYFSTKGYFTAAIDYRLAGKAGEPMKDKAKWPAQIEDCKLGIRWLRANAAKYHIDPDRFAVWGASAGGHLVGCLGTMDESRFEGEGGYAGVSSRVQAVVDFCGPADLTLFRPQNLFGFPYDSNPAVYADASPIKHIHHNMPPFLVVHGDKDSTVPYTQSVALVERLKQTGVSAELYTVHGGTHSMSPRDGHGATIEEWRPIQAVVLAFLDRQLKD